MLSKRHFLATVFVLKSFPISLLIQVTFGYQFAIKDIFHNIQKENQRQQINNMAKLYFYKNAIRMMMINKITIYIHSFIKRIY